MSTLFSRIMTAFMSLLFALNIVSTTDYQKPRPAYNPMLVTQSKNPDYGINQQNDDYELVEDNQDNEDPEKNDEQGGEVTPTEDANSETGNEDSNLPTDIEDNTANDNNDAAPVENEYSDLEVLETIDISATEDDNVTLTLYAPKAAAPATDDDAAEDELTTYSVQYAVPRMAARSMSRVAAYSMDDNDEGDAAPLTVNNVTTDDTATETESDYNSDGTVKVKFDETQITGENLGRDINAQTYITAVIKGDGDMEENVYRHFVKSDTFIEMSIQALAEEYELAPEDITFRFPDGMEPPTDLFEIDEHISYYADVDCKQGPAGTWLPITDSVRARINLADMLYYSPDAIKIEGNVTSISAGAFLFCDDLTKVEIPETVKEIGENAFSYCSNLEEVVLHEGLEKIGSGAFMYCSKLNKITLPSTVTEIGEEAFTFIGAPSEIHCPTEEVFKVININNNIITPENTDIVKDYEMINA